MSSAGSWVRGFTEQSVVRGMILCVFVFVCVCVFPIRI